MYRHQTPMLLRPVDHSICQIAIRDTHSGVVGQFQGLQICLLATIAACPIRSLFEIVLLDHEVRKLMVVEVKLHLVVKSLLAVGAEHFVAQELLSNIPRLEDDMLLPSFGAVDVKP
jgi:hypothetical protein